MFFSRWSTAVVTPDSLALVVIAFFLGDIQEAGFEVAIPMILSGF
ncbi:MAG: hypothetical protein ACRYG8_15995 [Janthinobacterium lividum]